MPTTITVRIDENGNPHIETKGFKGKACTQAVDKLLADMKRQGLEVKTTDIKYTQEYYQAAVQQTVKA